MKSLLENLQLLRNYKNIYNGVQIFQSWDYKNSSQQKCPLIYNLCILNNEKLQMLKLMRLFMNMSFHQLKTFIKTRDFNILKKSTQ